MKDRKRSSDYYIGVLDPLWTAVSRYGVMDMSYFKKLRRGTWLALFAAEERITGWYQGVKDAVKTGYVADIDCSRRTYHGMVSS